MTAKGGPDFIENAYLTARDQPSNNEMSTIKNNSKITVFGNPNVLTTDRKKYISNFDSSNLTSLMQTSQPDFTP